jgi:lipopolysaccharide/colanic/teichoic acid biosynthesis glycosyltransferase
MKVAGSGHNKPTPRIEENVKHTNSNQVSKRAFDILVSSIALLLLSPIFLLIALAIRLESRGPIFYISKRAGRGYKIFNFYKFRTMHKDADKKISELTHLNQYSSETASTVFFKINNDPRITRIGTFLRNTSLDELPQLINVFLGDMSLVGNRPLPLYEAANLTTDEYAARFMAPAGITGLWQVKKRGNKDMSVEERINIDIDYAYKCNFATDFWIIANTPSALLQKENV